MQEKSEPRTRRYRSKVEVLRLFEEYSRSEQSIKDFCTARGISQGSFHRWKHRYGKFETSVDAAAFASFQVLSEPGLFAAVGNIRIYQAVSAAYLKELVQ